MRGGACCDGSSGVSGQCGCGCCCAGSSVEGSASRSAGWGKGGKRNADGGCEWAGTLSCNIGVVGGVGCGVGLTTTTRGNGISADVGNWTSGTLRSQDRGGCGVGKGVDNAVVVVVAGIDLRGGIQRWFGNMSTMRRPTRGGDLPRVGTVDPEECGNTRGRSGVDGGTMVAIGGGNGDGDA